jgi:hypothetical protein
MKLKKTVFFCFSLAICSCASAQEQSLSGGLGNMSDAANTALTYFRQLQGIEYSATKKSTLSDTFIAANDLSTKEKNIIETETVRFGISGIFFCDASTLDAENNQMFGAISTWDGSNYQVFRKDSKLLSVGKLFKPNNAFAAGKLWALLPFWWIQPKVFFGEPPDACFDLRPGATGEIQLDLPNNAKAVTDPNGLMKELDFDRTSNNQTWHISIIFAEEEQSRILPIEITRTKGGQLVDKMQISWSNNGANLPHRQGLLAFPSKIVLTEFDERGQEQVKSNYSFSSPNLYKNTPDQFKIPESLADLISDEETGKTRIIRRIDGR